MKREDNVPAIVSDLQEQLPPPRNLEDIMKAKADDPSALHVVLFQEIERYNKLLVAIQSSCKQLLLGIKGLVVMSTDLDDIFHAVFNNKIPAVWSKAYPSTKPLGAWIRDLLLRLSELNAWIVNGYPKVSTPTTTTRSSSSWSK